MLHRRFLLAVFVSAITLYGIPALACSCRPFDPCESLSSTGNNPDYQRVVLLGVAEKGDKPVEPGLTRFRIEEVFRGLDPERKEISVTTGEGSGDCSVSFPEGARVVLFGTVAKRFPSIVQTGMCFGSFRPESNPKLLSAIREIASGKSISVIGSVFERSGPGILSAHRASGIPLRISNGHQTFKTTSDATGAFEFRLLTPGDWSVHVDDPGFSLGTERASGIPTKLENGCSFVRLDVWPNGKLSGVVRDQNGQPRPDVPVQLRSAPQAGSLLFSSTYSVETRSDPKGIYRFEGVPPGDYLIGVNILASREEQQWVPVYYPAATSPKDAQTVSLAGRQSRTGLDLQLAGNAVEALLLAEIVLEDGTPVKNPLITLLDSAGRKKQNWEFLAKKQEVPNPFPLKVFFGRTYSVESLNTKFDRSDGKEKIVGVYRGKVSGIRISQKEQKVRIVLKFSQK